MAESADPNRPKLRKLTLLPRCKKSKTESAEPILAAPATLRPEPKRVKWRTDKELPRYKKSNTEHALERREKLRKDNELPR